MKIAVTGATGQLGNLVVNELKNKVSPEQIVALARTPEKGKNLGVEVRPFDYNGSNLEESLAGIDRLMLISGSEIGQRAHQHKNIIDAAKKAGIQWIVYTSLLHADSSSLSLADEHMETEKMLKESGIPFTLLRNGWYTENYGASIPSALEHGALIGSAGNGKIASAARADYAEAAAIVITDTDNIGKVYELAGDDAYTLTEFASAISEVSGKEIPYNNIPEGQYASILESVGFPTFLAEAYAGFDTSAAKGDLFDNSKQLSKLIGRPTTPMIDTVKSAI